MTSKWLHENQHLFTSKPFPKTTPIETPRETQKRSIWISSFGRRQNKAGKISFGSLDPNGYRKGIKITKNIQLPVHTLVNIYFNDPDLVKWCAEKARCTERNSVTTDHIFIGKDFRSENYWWRLRWATNRLQSANRVLSSDGKANMCAKRSIGLVQVREWRGRVKGLGRGWTGGTPDPWEDVLRWVGA